MDKLQGLFGELNEISEQRLSHRQASGPRRASDATGIPPCRRWYFISAQPQYCASGISPTGTGCPILRCSVCVRPGSGVGLQRAGMCPKPNTVPPVCLPGPCTAADSDTLASAVPFNPNPDRSAHCPAELLAPWSWHRIEHSPTTVNFCNCLGLSQLKVHRAPS